MLWLFVGPTGAYLLDFFCSGIQFLFTVESLSLLYEERSMCNENSPAYSKVLHLQTS